MINILIHSSVLLNNYIEGKPNFIVGPISDLLGYILNFLFNMVYYFTINNSLGIAIILLTIVARSLMIPLAFKQQKSVVSMRKIQPETEKIKAKYKGTKDPELQRKMNAEIQVLYSKNKINPLSGCLPMFITLPIFFALSSVMRQTYLHVGELGHVYDGISAVLVNDVKGYLDILAPLVYPKMQTGMDFAIDPGYMDNAMLVTQISRALNKFTPDDWSALISGVQAASADAFQSLMALVTKKQQIENFLGIDLISSSGWTFPNIIIPILTGATTFLSTWILNKQQGSSTDPAMKTQQNMMLIVMPVMMTWMTTSLSAGVGIYWITSSVYQTVQQVLLNKYYTRDGAVLAGSDDAKQPKEIITIDKSRNKKKGER